MGRPTKFPEWADGGAAITEPTGAKKLLGWVIGEKPAAQFLNWLLNLGFLWFVYLDRQMGVQFFGDGSDGAVTLDGAVTPSWASKVGSVYTLNRDIFMTNLTIAAAVTLKVNGFVVYGTGTLDLSAAGALITADGITATGSLGVAGAATPPGTMAGTNAGGGGGTFGSPAGGNGTGTMRLGGAGGNGGSGGTSGSGGTGTALVNRQGKLNTLLRMPGWLFGTDGTSVPAAVWTVAQGGGGGGGGCADGVAANAIGGGGGAGGGVVALWFVNIVHGAQPLSNVSAKGGGGANGTPGTGSAAGGGGGGGGWLDVLCVTKDVGGYVAANSCPGGAAGTSTGFGAAQAGATGFVRELKLGA